MLVSKILFLGKFTSLRISGPERCELCHLRVNDDNSVGMLDLLDHGEHLLDDLIGHDTEAARRAEEAEDVLLKLLWTHSVDNRSQFRYLAAQHHACHGGP